MTKAEYIKGDRDHNVKVALMKLREAYCHPDGENCARQFAEAEEIIISALLFGNYDIVRKEE